MKSIPWLLNYHKTILITVLLFIILFLLTVVIPNVGKNTTVFTLKNSFHKDTSCNVFEGRWVWDNVSRPLYDEKDCSFMHKYTACQTSGRPDTFYKYWRWQPMGCNLELFDPLKLLNMLRGKILMFVGDSVQRNQYDSLVCMIQSVIPKEKITIRKLPPSIKIFSIEELKVSIEFFWTPFLVPSTSDDIDDHGGEEKLLYLDSIKSRGNIWKMADILVFNSHLWWSENPFLNCTYKGKNDTYTSLDAYEIALKEWANWVKNNVNYEKQKIFFMGTSPTHWGINGLPESSGNCFTKILPSLSKNWKNTVNMSMDKIARKIVDNPMLKVNFMDITQMSLYRIDAHTSYYKKFKDLNWKDSKAKSRMYGDCLHWCLPGVPDAWNELLFYYFSFLF